MIWLILAALFIFLGFAMQKLKWYFLISGYNTMSKEQKENVDTEGLARLMAKFSYFLALLFILIGIAEWQNYSQLILPLILALIAATIIVVIKSQKFNHNILDEKGKVKKGAGKQMKRPIIILAITVIAVAVIMTFAVSETKIIMHENQLEIKGMYGDEYSFDKMEQVTLLQEIPNIAIRTNGSSVGSKHKGHFKLKNGEKVKLFVDKRNPPFISFFVADQHVIFNLATAEETDELYKKLEQKVAQ
ncbi:DUF3784 domain-containing protein [Solibacillus sp. FSL R7-0682]|uniref:DUF3784 domain-containing protein n=1 Tax=Solibacillus sp. FSL R7-0682 TaxID=2921690 RepID=UPI0030F52F74